MGIQPKGENNQSATCADTSAQIYHYYMKLTDLLIARERLENEIQNNASNASPLVVHLANQLENYTGAWAKHILKSPTNDKPFVDILTPLCKEEIKKNSDIARQFAAEQILHGARVLRLAAIVTTLKRVAAGEFVLEDEGA